MASTTMKAIVKSVLSGDTLILRGRPINGQPPKERTLHLAGLTAPRIGSRDRPDEPWAFESREFVRSMIVGKEIGFTISYTIPSGGEFGVALLVSDSNPPVDVALEIVKNGWAKLRENTKPGNAEDETDGESPEQARRNQLKEAEEMARLEGKGLWSETNPSLEVNYSMPEDPAAFLSEYKGKNLDAVIENVSNGTTVRARLLLSPNQHQLVTLTMAGVRSPRSRQYSPQTQADNSTAANEGEPFGDEAKFFTECRLLQRSVSVVLISLPTPQATSLTSQAQSQQSLVVSSFIGIVQHPAGSIAALLLANGLARVVDWHAGFLSSVPEQQGGGMERLRKAEAEGKASRRGHWKLIASPAGDSSAAHDSTGAGAPGKMKFEGLVSRVWTGDTLSIRVTSANKSEGQEERKVQLSSIRQPRPTDPKFGGLASDARELLRRRLIGKQVHVSIDYVRPREGDYEEKECVTIKLPTGINAANLLLERGYATVLRHRQGEDRSQDYDALMATEMKAQTEGKGLHSDKEFPPPKITDVSESSSRANSYLSGWKRQGKMPAVVDYVASGSRFKIWLPKQDLKFTLVLSGIKCPKTARHPGERNEPFGAEALDFANRNVMQRDVEVEIESTDKSGGFIGGLFLNKTDNFALQLVKEGLASCNEFSLDRSPYGKELKTAEDQAKLTHKNLWKNFDEQPSESIAQISSGIKSLAIKPNFEYIDLIISDIREPVDSSDVSFSVQILKNGGIPELTSLMTDFAVYHRSAPISSTAASGYRTGDLVSAKFSVDNAWYRAKIRKNLAHKKEAEVVFIDYGNSEVVSHSNIRSLDPRFKSLPPQAKEATLSFVKLLGPDTEYGSEALDRFRSLVEGQTLVANIDYRDPTQNGRLHLSLYDTADSPTSTSSLNHRLVREGYALINLRAPYKSAYQDQYSALEDAKKEAKRNRAGAYEFGDAFED
ncbi:hypothetical protein MJO29_009850 [Puccinia striiformis f. sp. tritici]|uniref:Transcription factor n=1 Tax=Puccinia striiformis f. sp. tritici PST-78 TaxID=1165861 RepID=A0A0L0UWR6_9BASI|nr:hypothetical protein Pst134EA_018916 [Puccinia striiformis f. sp. tritici]KAI9625599.1 hypothetical protein KEM48_010861 [Puccinia striiformis f. sp. tritici PST-130]KNE91396.1 hypothetical protein PSTG_15188 [Puccinia striiformis f. sp. tritici PST-78]KAH9448966.1 hypothetical protein Pst134EB_019807 [Puccinia striiformis f. sp. tritici]KAH9458760.1 hypothetical protein Pst134EA_018916 [Puccinia striiformis f. sp. tritici]KAI7948185.1 hypothetical protein MJO29_009850 [Puccinia striiformis